MREIVVVAPAVQPQSRSQTELLGLGCPYVKKQEVEVPPTKCGGSTAVTAQCQWSFMKFKWYNRISTDALNETFPKV